MYNMPGAFPDDSSPLSSLGSPIETPPSAWYGQKTSDGAPAPSHIGKENHASPSVSSAPSVNGSTNGSKKRRLDSPSPAHAEQMHQQQQVQPSTEPQPPRAKKQRQQPKATPPPPPPSSRPSRARKAPERYVDAPITTTKKAAAAATKSPRSKAKPTSKVFDPVYITTNPRSRLTKTDLYHLLLEPAAWTRLTLAQQQHITSLLQPSARFTSSSSSRSSSAAPNGNGSANGESSIPRPNIFGPNSNLFRTDVAKYHQELTDGCWTKTWQAEGEQAVRDRAAGKYDAWKAEEAEDWWGQK